MKVLLLPFLRKRLFKTTIWSVRIWWVTFHRTDKFKTLYYSDGQEHKCMWPLPGTYTSTILFTILFYTILYYFILILTTIFSNTDCSTQHNFIFSSRYLILLASVQLSVLWILTYQILTDHIIVLNNLYLEKGSHKTFETLAY